MNDRYPYIRFVLDAAHVIAGALAAIIFLSGTVRSCHHGGFPGFISFLITVAVAAVVYVVVMVKLEVLRVLLDIESSSRQRPAAPRSDPPSVPSVSA